MGTKLKRILLLLPLIALCCTFSTTASAQSGAEILGQQIPTWAYPYVVGTGNVYAISPPGENALVTSSTPASRNAFDQAGPYASLATGVSKLSMGNLTNYLHQETVGISPAQVVRVEHPNPDVYIYRDSLDIPHIYGKTDTALAWGAGYVAVEDKLFAMDVLRHLGSGTLASLAGPSCSFEQMDYAQISQTGYTPEQDQTMVNNLANEGPLGKETLSLVDTYVKGINAAIAYDLSDPKTRLPIEYSLLGKTPQPFSAGDVISVLNVISAQDGEGGGGELANVGLLDYFKSVFGPNNAMSAFLDFKDQNDPNTPDTVSKPFPYMLTPTTIDQNLNVYPDNPTQPLVVQISNLTPGCSDAPPTKVGSEILSFLGPGLQFNSKTSNAVLISTKYSTTGHPIAVFGPQIGYFSPTVFVEEDLHSPDISASGVSLAGMNFTILFGRGNSYAWSGTSSGADDVDEVIDFLCNPNGSVVSPTSNWYTYDGKCTQMTEFDSVENLKPTLIANGQSATNNRKILRTIQGVVQGFTKVKSVPVAVVLQRAANMREEDALVGLVRFSEPSMTHDPQSFFLGAETCPWALNWYFINNQHIAYYSGGLLPIRNPHVDPNFPTNGTGIANWQGWLPSSNHPQVIDPASGVIINWNNQSAPQFSAADNDYSHGPIYRSSLLTNALNNALRIHGGKLNQAQVLQAVETAGLTDMSASGLFSEIKKAIGPISDPHIKEMMDTVSTWVQSGSLRVLNLDSSAPTNLATGGLTPNSQYKNAAAIAIWDEGYLNLVESVFNPIFAQGGISTYQGTDTLYNQMNQLPFVASPNGYGTKQGDSYGAGFEGLLWRVLREVNKESVGAPFSSPVNDKVCLGGISTCKTALLNALTETYNTLESINTTPNIALWNQDSQSQVAKLSIPNLDSISYTMVGLADAPDMVWQNRPTFQQDASFTANEPSNSGGSTGKLIAALLVGVGTLVVTVSLITAFLATARRRKAKNIKLE
ncbi:MAG: hypothetical protein HKL80_02525 [Acidimicrobiales bacterium]|nr:hypothetical protein [Acidimicrobiales bacterium]